MGELATCSIGLAVTLVVIGVVLWGL